MPNPADEISASDRNYTALYRVREGDLVISHINAIHGAVAVIPPELDGLVATTEYTVCRPKAGIDARIIWLLLRSPEIRSDLLLNSTGIGRTRVRWDSASKVEMPTPPDSLSKALTRQVKQAEKKEREARDLRAEAQAKLIEQLDLDSDEAQRIIAAFKPPR